MKRSTDRILTTHVGSLPRPPELLAVSKGQDPPSDPASYTECLNQAVTDIVRAQARAGIDIVNDGEFGKFSWSTYILERISGFELRPDQMRPVEWLGRERETFADYLAEAFPRVLTGVPTEACVGPIRYQGYDRLSLSIDSLVQALDGVDVEEAFMTAVAPGSTAYDGVNEYYASDREYVFAIADALREEYLAIQYVRCPYLQEPGAVQAMGAASRRRAKPRASRYPGG
jgi:5-methyltetrahydropteroyltriglutamate--homocysteine methyltransferase